MKEAFLQSRHTNLQLKEQLHCVLKEENDIRVKTWDLQSSVRAMRAELRRINQAEERNAFLEAEIQATRKELEEERATLSLEEQYFEKLKKDNGHLRRRFVDLSEESLALTESQKIDQQNYLLLSCHVNKLRRQLQESKLASSEQDAFSAKMEYQIQKQQQCVQEYEANIQVLQDRELALRDKLLDFTKKKPRRHIQFPGNILNINPKCLMNEIISAELVEEGMRRIEKNPKGRRLWWVKRALWCLSVTFLVAIFVLNFYLTNERVTRLYHQPLEILGYRVTPALQLYLNGTLPH